MLAGSTAMPWTISPRNLDHACIAFKALCGTGKAQIKFDKVPLDRATEYAAEDADVTLRLWEKLNPGSRAKG